MAKKLNRAIRTPLKMVEEDGKKRFLSGSNEVILPKDKKWESKLNDAGLDKESIKALERKGVIGKGDDEDDEDEGATSLIETPVADLAAALEGVSDVQELRRLRRRDKRATARPLYDARIDAVKDAEKAE